MPTDLTLRRTIAGTLCAASLSVAAWSATALGAAPSPPGLPATAAVFVRHLQASARRAAVAPDVVVASAATATMLATCGLCHDAIGERERSVRGRSIGSLVVGSQRHAVRIVTISNLLDLLGRGDNITAVPKPRRPLRHRAPQRKRPTSAGPW